MHPQSYRIAFPLISVSRRLGWPPSPVIGCSRHFAAHHQWRPGSTVGPFRLKTWLVSLRCFHAGLRRANRTGKQATLSRKERRLMERKAKKLERKKQKKVSVQPENSNMGSSANSFSWVHSWRQYLRGPKLPGGSSRLQKQHLKEIGKRLPFWLILLYLFTSDDTSPFVIDMAQGPSMLPTIFPIGDFYLRDTGAWYRWFGIQRKYNVGDVIVFRDPKTNRYACKRIVGVEGDQVRRYGQFVERYQHRQDWGICASHESASHDLSWDKNDLRTDRSDEMRRVVEVPPQHVWLEGDFPPFSCDSRHYGPVPVDSIRGRCALRLWPLWRAKDMPDLGIASGNRPDPLVLETALSGAYNLHPKPKPRP